MTQYAIITDLNRCVGCLGCSVACKVVNEVEIGSYWNKVLRVGPYPDYEGAQFPDVYTYFLPITCQHCAHPECVNVCPTGASFKREDGTIQIDAEMCIGCQSCVSACPYGVRYLNESTSVVEKCTLCVDKIDKGELPQCVAQCGARARFFGNLDDGIESFMGAGKVAIGEDTSYDAVLSQFCSFGEIAKPYEEGNIYHLPDVGNEPSFMYILRDHEWKGYE